VHRVVAGVALPNAASIALHKRLGFQDVGVFTEVGLKFDRYWDVRWFERPLSR
jgi:phosphinothricin acetyltransferase